MSLTINSGRVLLTRDSDGASIFDTDRKMPHILSTIRHTVTFAGPAIYYSPALLFDTSVVIHHVYMGDYRTYSWGGTGWSSDDVFLVSFIKVTTSGYGLNSGAVGRWINMQGSLITRTWGSVDPTGSATGGYGKPTGFGGGEVYTISRQGGTVSLARTIVAGNGLWSYTPAGVALDDLLGQTPYSSEWPRSELTNMASSAEVCIYVCRS